MQTVSVGLRKSSDVWCFRGHSHTNNQIPFLYLSVFTPFPELPHLQSKHNVKNYSTYDTTLKQLLSFSLNTQIVSDQLY